MDQKIKRKWLRELRSGNRRQGRGYLRSGRYQCCLGVLCSVLGAKWDNGRPVLNGMALDNKKRGYGTGNKMLNRKTLSMVGLRGRDQRALAIMNDAIPMTPFRQIADYIEQKL